MGTKSETVMEREHGEGTALGALCAEGAEDTVKEWRAALTAAGMARGRCSAETARRLAAALR
ncbi:MULTISPECIES: hypothetical protein [Streptomyces]|uniref:hypothetical protein n=1 Tax=Streptomyces TaxID=1883 RepID=UPI00131AF546|nr:hypothetical protein [Streptomyces sp. NRRL F-4707]